MTPAEAFAAIPLAAVCCDSNFGREEAHSLKEQLVRRSPYRSMTPLAFGERIEGLLHLFRRDHWQELIRQAIPVFTSTQQELAYGLAVQLVLCDREVKPAEATFLTPLGNELSLPPGRTAQIQEVLALLQRDVLIGETVA
ncbi:MULTISPECIES: tellurite resistance TerB family protein [unclassified Cyanobium]|uniref:tellurite resistance TerB family protein n=1 Tax=unclassified Cyanobium TaxID=2627006 RepID=UPI0020CCFB3F|nr:MULTISPECIES: tellurite resistance TerB family protein [unclassified Cyanobium]MCP9857504.1 tellurite resistance TerB family protein [Cyanobium sp. Cruz-8H5]MCP9864924.1 tellurite resistance TerB family protein [Cyanobium sp. Cruz-8D1]